MKKKKDISRYDFFAELYALIPFIWLFVLFYNDNINTNQHNVILAYLVLFGVVYSFVVFGLILCLLTVCYMSCCFYFNFSNKPQKEIESTERLIEAAVNTKI